MSTDHFHLRGDLHHMSTYVYKGQILPTRYVLENLILNSNVVSQKRILPKNLWFGPNCLGETWHGCLWSLSSKHSLKVSTKTKCICVQRDHSPRPNDAKRLSCFWGNPAISLEGRSQVTRGARDEACANRSVGQVETFRGGNGIQKSLSIQCQEYPDVKDT